MKVGEELLVYNYHAGIRGDQTVIIFFMATFPRPGEFKPQISVGKNTETVEFIGVLWCPDVL